MQNLEPERWVEAYGNILYRYALTRVNNEEKAEDLVQETFLAALHSRHAFSGKSTQQTWLIGILKHKIFDYYRTRYREMPVTDLVSPDDSDQQVEDFFDRAHHWKRAPASWSAPRKALENKQFWQVFYQCLENLPRRWADVFILRVLEQMPTEEVRNILGVSSTNLGVLMHRSRIRLRECLELNWFKSKKKAKR